MIAETIPGTRLLTPSAYYEATKDQRRYVREVSGDFERGISKGQKKRIAKCERIGFRSTERASIVTCYPIIKDNRERKGRPYSMTLHEWVIMHRALPGTVHCFTVDPGPVAAAMCVLVKPDVLYVQAWGDVPGQEQNSPVAMLARGIYRWCDRYGVKVMDIGTADDDGLIKFKRSLGFEVRA